MPSGTITALTVQASDQERVNVFVDGAFAIGISLRTLQREGLRKGQVLSEEDWARLERAEADSKAWNAALRLLEVRPRTEHEIRDRLRRKQYAPEQIDAAVARLRELELLDDTQFARMWVANRSAVNPRGALGLKRELLRKGVAREVAADVVGEAVDDETEAAACEQVARGAAGRYAGVESWPDFQRKLGGLLQRRGFSWNTAGPIVRRLWAERGETDDELDDRGEL